jgi:hypothetical protein
LNASIAHGAALLQMRDLTSETSAFAKSSELVQGEVGQALEATEPEEIDTAELLSTCTSAELPVFLQSTARVPFSPQNADEVAELVAAAPGPLGQELAADDWFDAVILGYLANAWKNHAHRMAVEVRSVVSVRFVCT